MLIKTLLIAVGMSIGSALFLKSCNAVGRFVDEDRCYDGGGYVDGDFCVSDKGREKL